MCGLILAPSHFPDDDILAAMDRMGYRGKDGLKGLTGSGPWKLGHVRLAIQDLSPAADQPFHRRSGVTAFVGEFFTHEGDELEYVDHLLRSLARGNHMPFHQADGFWAIANLDAGAASVYTDHLGIKPLYYWPHRGIVCSEIEPMFALKPAPPLDETYLSNCIKWGYDYSGRTPYQGIIQIAPGTKLTLDPYGDASATTYWQWHYVDSPPPLRDLVIKAIENRLIGEREIALLLSGGLDSSIIYYVLKERGHKVQAFSVENGESEYLPADVSIMEFPSLLPEEAMRVLQAPLDLGSMVPQVQLARAVAAMGFNVCLSGDGADEVFGGYRRAQDYDSQKSDIFCELPYYHLPRLDRAMMRSTIELRSPFLAPAVVAFGMRLPRQYRMAKEALKSAFTGIVPDEILRRPKHPLKTEAVREGGTTYRAELVQSFRQSHGG